MRNRVKSILVVFLGCCLSFLAHAETGVTNKVIVLGQSVALSGPAQQLGTEMRDGALAYFDHINAQGGVNGRQIVLKTLDDGYEADRASANTKQLIEKEGAFALFGYVGTPTSNAAMPLINKEEIPFFAPFTGAQSLREPFNRNVFISEPAILKRQKNSRAYYDPLNQAHCGVLSKRCVWQSRFGRRHPSLEKTQYRSDRAGDGGAQ